MRRNTSSRRRTAVPPACTRCFRIIFRGEPVVVLRGEGGTRPVVHGTLACFSPREDWLTAHGYVMADGLRLRLWQLTPTTRRSA